MNALVGLCVCWNFAGPPGDPIRHLQQFPPPVVIERMCDLAEAHREWLFKWRHPGAPYWKDWEAWEIEARHLRDDWLNLRAAWDTRRELWERHAYLFHLFECLSVEDYYAGRMPPPVPVWRFERR